MASRIPWDRNVRLRYRRIKAFNASARPAQGTYLLHVLKLLLGTCRSAGPRPAPRLETAIGHVSGRAQGVYLFRVLKLLLCTCCSTGPKESISVTSLETAVGHLSFHWAQGRAQGI